MKDVKSHDSDISNLEDEIGVKILIKPGIHESKEIYESDHTTMYELKMFGEKWFTAYGICSEWSDAHLFDYFTIDVEKKKICFTNGFYDDPDTVETYEYNENNVKNIEHFLQFIEDMVDMSSDFDCIHIEQG